jgi:hypothetical protein
LLLNILLLFIKKIPLGEVYDIYYGLSKLGTPTSTGGNSHAGDSSGIKPDYSRYKEQIFTLVKGRALSCP